MWLDGQVILIAAGAGENGKRRILGVSGEDEWVWITWCIDDCQR